MGLIFPHLGSSVEIEAQEPETPLPGGPLTAEVSHQERIPQLPYGMESPSQSFSTPCHLSPFLGFPGAGVTLLLALWGHQEFSDWQGAHVKAPRVNNSTGGSGHPTPSTPAVVSLGIGISAS